MDNERDNFPQNNTAPREEEDARSARSLSDYLSYCVVMIYGATVITLGLALLALSEGKFMESLGKVNLQKVFIVVKKVFFEEEKEEKIEKVSGSHLQSSEDLNNDILPPFVGVVKKDGTVEEKFSDEFFQENISESERMSLMKR